MSKKITLDVIGKRYGKLVIVEYSHTKKNGSFWKCLCDCGNESIVAFNHLREGGTTSCGCNKTCKKSLGESGLRNLYKTYVNNARKKNLFFDLTIEEFKEITFKDCVYCGSKPVAESSGYSNNNKVKIKDYMIYRYNGIDRIDSNKGYEKDNIVSCCKWCNQAKSNKPVDEFKRQIFRMYEYLNKKNV